jgi:hypothetical protein
MQKASFSQRFLYPVGTVLIILLVSKVIYETAWHIDNYPAHYWIAFFSGAIHVLALWLGSFIIYPWAYFKGASLTERVIGCFIPPIAWTISEIVRVTEFFTIGESLYFGLNSQFLVSCAMTLFFMGVLELVCRAIQGKHMETGLKVLSIGPIAAMFSGLGGIYVFLIWGVGAHWFYVYQQGYKVLFH